MSYQCENCQSMFFKTLETRLCAENSAILYKKRCKRCKYKYLVRKAVPAGQVAQATREEWLQASKIASAAESAGQSRISERPKILVGEYSQRISSPAEAMRDYLRKIWRAEHQGRGGAGHGAP